MFNKEFERVLTERATPATAEDRVDRSVTPLFRSSLLTMKSYATTVTYKSPDQDRGDEMAAWRALRV